MIGVQPHGSAHLLHHCWDISSKPVCLTDKQMSSHVTHVEMDSDRMGNHVNVKGIAVFRLVFSEDGRVVCAVVVSGHPLGEGEMAILLRN
jgi:hypothetical protein